MVVQLRKNIQEHGGSITKRIKLFGAYIDVPVDDAPHDDNNFSGKENDGTNINFEVIKPMMKIKKRAIRVAGNLVPPPPPMQLPIEYKNVIRTLNKGLVVHDEVLVIEKDLYDSDVLKTQNRFSMPLKKIKKMFLRDAEMEYLKTPEEGKTKFTNKLHVTLIDPEGRHWNVNLGIWQMKKDFITINGSNWGKVVLYNDLRKGDRMQLWAVRVGDYDKLWFVLIRIRKAPSSPDA